MVQESPFMRFLKFLDGLAEDESPRVRPAPAPPPKPAPIQSEAYKNRKLGRKLHREGIKDMQRIADLIERCGEAKPGELAQKLGMSRSTLTYNLKRLMRHDPGFEGHRRDFWTRRPLRAVLGEKRLEKLGSGNSVRYRIVQEPVKKSPES